MIVTSIASILVIAIVSHDPVVWLVAAVSILAILLANWIWS